VHDQSPLAYVVALHLALQNGFRDSQDFGSGVGSGGLLFSKHGFSISLGDVSSALLDFSRRRLQARGAPATYSDLKTTELPAGQYDFITAMDVFEHIAEPRKPLSHKPGRCVLAGFFLAASMQSRMRIIRHISPTILLPPLSG